MLFSRRRTVKVKNLKNLQEVDLEAWQLTFVKGTCIIEYKIRLPGDDGTNGIIIDEGNLAIPLNPEILSILEGNLEKLLPEFINALNPQ
jgi:heme oxygenase